MTGRSWIVGQVAAPAVAATIPVALGVFTKQGAAWWLLTLLILLTVANAWKALFDARPDKERSLERKLRDRRRMLRLVETTATRVINTNFSDTSQLPTELLERPDLIELPLLLTDSLVANSAAGNPEMTRGASSDIYMAFNQSSGSLLVAGNGGSGKFTMLAGLCRDLCQKVDHSDEGIIIPVLVSLGSWKESDSSLESWLYRAIEDNYSVPSKYTEEWIADGALLPILDGLDDVPIKLRAKVVLAVNKFLSEGLNQVIISSRTKEYLDCRTKLTVSYAVEILPPERQRVEDFLNNLRSPVADAVHSVPYKDKAWWEMISTPLMLRIIARICKENPDASLVRKGSAHQRREHIIGEYVRSLTNRDRGRSVTVNRDDGVHWLGWLAEWMTRHKGSEFYFDRIEPEWISDVTDAAKVKYQPLVWSRRGNTILTVTLAVLLPIIYGVESRVSTVDISVALLWIFASTQNRLIFQAELKKKYCSPAKPIEPVWTISIRSWSNLTTLTVGVAIGASAYFILPFLHGDISSTLPTFFLVAGVAISSTALNHLAVETSPASIPNTGQILPGERLARSRRYAMVRGIGISFPVSLTFNFLIILYYHGSILAILVGASFGVMLTWSSWLYFGGAPVLQHRFFTRQLAKVDRGPADYLRFLEWSSGRLLLRAIGGAYSFPHREIQQYLAESWRRKQ